MDDTWYPDTGATNHFTSDLSNLLIKNPYCGNEKVLVGNGTSLHIDHTGFSKLKSPSSSFTFTLNNVLHVPGIRKNLLSVAQFARDNSVFFEFHPDTFFVKSQATRRQLLQGRFKDGLYAFNELQLADPHSFNTAYALFTSTVCNNFKIWHSRLGHCATKIVKFVLNHCNIPIGNCDLKSVCDSCCLGKAHKLPFSDSDTIYTEPLQLVYSDIWGPTPTKSKEGFQYYILFLDAYSKFSWVYFL